MLIRVVFITVTVLAISQATAAVDKEIQEPNNSVREFLEIDGRTYYVDTDYGYRRHEAKVLCEAKNMHLLAFDEVGQWESINTWIGQNGLEIMWFWTDAVREINSTIWRWETSGAEITEFNWAEGQPTMNYLAFRSCISFSLYTGGYDDDKCDEFFRFGVICE